MSLTLDEMRKKEREEGIKKGEKRGEKRGFQKGRVQTIGLLLTCNSPAALMSDPRFLPLSVTQAEIDAALALNR